MSGGQGLRALGCGLSVVAAGLAMGGSFAPLAVTKGGSSDAPSIYYTTSWTQFGEGAAADDAAAQATTLYGVPLVAGALALLVAAGLLLRRRPAALPWGIAGAATLAATIWAIWSSRLAVQYTLQVAAARSRVGLPIPVLGAGSWILLPAGAAALGAATVLVVAVRTLRRQSPVAHGTNGQLPPGWQGAPQQFRPPLPPAGRWS